MSKFKTTDDYFEFSKRLVVIPTEDILELIKKHKLKFPCFVYGFLLKETIRQKVFEEKLYSTYTDEQKFRLRGYDNYSIYPLEKIIKNYNLDFDLARFKELLFDFMFLNMDVLGVRNSFIKELEQLQHNYTVDLEVMKYEDFLNMFKTVIYSENGYLDGVLIDTYTDDVLASYTLGDLKGLGKKYEITVPRRINKSKLIEILTAKFKLTDEESQLLAKKSVLDLEIYAREKGFKISIDLKKRDMIEFIKYSMGMYHKEFYKDKFNYQIPLITKEEEVVSDMVDDLEEPVIKEEKVAVDTFVEEEVEPEVIVEETIEVGINKEEPEEEIVIDESEEEIVIEETSEIQEDTPEEIIIEEDTDQEAEEIVEEEIIEELVEEKPLEEVKKPVDNSLLSNAEKELLDEKINQIIKKYYKKRRKRRVWLTIVIILVIGLLGLAGYAYLYYTNIDPGNLPFGIPVFW